jgi:hypothetical protein
VFNRTSFNTIILAAEEHGLHELVSVMCRWMCSVLKSVIYNRKDLEGILEGVCRKACSPSAVEPGCECPSLGPQQ